MFPLVTQAVGFVAKRPALIGLAALAVFSGVQTYRVASLKGDVAQERQQKAEMVRDYETARAAGEEAARKALQEAMQEADRIEQALRQRIREAEREADARTAEAAEQARAWRQRYEAAKRDDPSCAEWANTPIACPVGDAP